MITATYTNHYGHTNAVKVDHLVNRGAWWGKTYLIEIGIGNGGGLTFVVEASSESDALDEFADSKYSHLIDVDPADIPQSEEEEEHTDYSRAGNDGHWVNLIDVALHPCTVNYFAPPENTRRMYVRISEERGVSIYLPDDPHAPQKDFPDCRAYYVPSWYALPTPYAIRQETGYTWVEYPDANDPRYTFQGKTLGRALPDGTNDHWHSTTYAAPISILAHPTPAYDPNDRDSSIVAGIAMARYYGAQVIVTPSSPLDRNAYSVFRCPPHQASPQGAPYYWRIAADGKTFQHLQWVFAETR